MFSPKDLKTITSLYVWPFQLPSLENLSVLTLLKVRIAAMEAFAAMFRSIPKKSQAKFFSLMPAVLNILPPLKDSSESEELSSAFIALIELAEISPKMFKSSFSDLVKFSISVIADKELSDQVRQNALELMATFADYAPNMCKKEPNFAQEMVTQCLSLMTDVGADDDDAEEWNASEDVSSDILTSHSMFLTFF